MADFSNVEHILPQGLGGHLCNQKFETYDVCDRCNHISGLYVDGAFLRNWFVKNDEAITAREFMDIENGSVLPLVYMGHLQGIELGEWNTCENWLGPCGELIYHFNNLANEENAFGYAGGHPLAARKEPGRVYLFLTTKQPFWIKTALLSLKSGFPRARRVAGNFTFMNDDPLSKIFSPQDNEDLARIVSLNQYWHDIASKQDNDCSHHTRIGIQTNFEERFLAKLAIGLGNNFLDARFQGSESAEHLRRILRLGAYRESPAEELPRTGYWDGASWLDKVLSIKGAHTLCLIPMKDHFVLSLTLFGGKTIACSISDEPELWADQKDIGMGIVYVIAQQAKKFIGPIELIQFVAHQNGSSRHPQLDILEKMRVPRSALPPCEIGKN